MSAIAERSNSGQDALPVCLFNENPTRLVSLWEMLPYSVHRLYKVMAYLDREIHQLFRRERDRGAYDKLRVIDMENSNPFSEFGSINCLLDCADEEFKALELESGREQIYTVRFALPTIGLAELRARLTGIRELLQGELKRRKFTYIPQSRARYFGQETPFGDQVATRFQSANREAVEASNAMAANLPTAAVFHLMRCAELGMRAVARERRVKLKKVESIELAEWSQIIRALERKADQVQNWKGRTNVKSTALEFYSGVAGELRGFRDEYRNYTAHMRKSYGPNAAEDAFTKVRCFMVKIAAHLAEDSNRAIAWTKVKT